MNSVLLNFQDPKYMNHHCLEIKHESPNWYGDLEDDCCAKWMELLLHAEWMYGEGLDTNW